jgi:hypothetical protein
MTRRRERPATVDVGGLPSQAARVVLALLVHLVAATSWSVTLKHGRLQQDEEEEEGWIPYDDEDHHVDCHDDFDCGRGAATI